MKKNITFFGLVFLLSINIFLAYVVLKKNRNISFLNNKISEFEVNDKYTTLKIGHCSKVVTWLQKTNKISFSSKQTLQNEHGDTIHFSNVAGGKPKLVFRYSELNCNICVDSQMKFIKEFINKYGYENFIMISSYKYKKNISLFKTLNSINNEIYNVEVLDSSLDRLNIPYYFILDKICQPTMFHFPDKIFPEDTKEYFKSIEDQYFNDL